MSEVKNPINYNELTNLIRNELVEVANLRYDEFKNIVIKISADLQFIKREFKDHPDGIYFVVTFSQAAINYGHSVVPCSIKAITQKNRIELTKSLLSDFAQAYNLNMSEDRTLEQIYTCPNVVKNFEAVSWGLESIISVDGAFVISRTANFFDLFYINADLESISDNVYFRVDELSKLTRAIEYEGENTRRVMINKGVGVFNLMSISSEEIEPPETATAEDYNCLNFSEEGEIIVRINNYELTIVYTSGNILDEAIVNESALEALLGYDGGDKYYDIVFDGIVYKFYPVAIYVAADIGCEFVLSSELVSPTGSATIILNAEKTLALDQSYGADFNLDSQVMYEHNNFSSSETKNGTVSLGFTSYLLFDSWIQNQALAMSMKMKSTLKNKYLIDIPKGVNQTFCLKVVYTNGYSLIDQFKIMSFKAGSQLGQLPSVVMSFTN